MTDLRADLIEALMQREYSHDDEVDANLALDTVLDVLADRADEWCEGSYDTKMLDRGIPLELIAVLREGDEQ